jgi:putative PIN family toxin of toxin-antitoxin system
LLCLVPDTNIWISAFITPGGLCEELVRACGHESLVFLISRFILGEIEEVLVKKLEIPEPMAEERLRYVIRHTQLVESPQKIRAVPACGADNRFLECAVTGRASYLVTWDKSHLLPLERFEGVEIVTPRRMVDLLQL